RLFLLFPAGNQDHHPERDEGSKASTELLINRPESSRRVHAPRLSLDLLLPTRLSRLRGRHDASAVPQEVYPAQARASARRFQRPRPRSSGKGCTGGNPARLRRAHSDEFAARRNKIEAAVTRQLAAFCVFVADIELQGRAPERLEAAIMGWTAPPPFCDIPD